MAHEVAHVVQQRGARARSSAVDAAAASDRYEREAARARRPPSPRARAVHRRASARARRVQRLGLSDALDYFADKANLHPRLPDVHDRARRQPDQHEPRRRAAAANILRAVIEFIPGGALITQALDNYGVFEKVGAWVEQQIDDARDGRQRDQEGDRQVPRLARAGRDIFDLGGVWERAKRIFTEPITQAHRLRRPASSPGSSGSSRTRSCGRSPSWRRARAATTC